MILACQPDVFYKIHATGQGECTAVSKKHSWTSGRMVVKKQKTDKTPSIVEKYDGFNEAVKWTG